MMSPPSIIEAGQNDLSSTNGRFTAQRHKLTSGGRESRLGNKATILAMLKSPPYTAGFNSLQFSLLQKFLVISVYQQKSTPTSA
jgi:hypothetical protein